MPDFLKPTRENDIALCPCKGYPSLTYLNKAFHRFANALDRDQEPVIVYFGDYDPSGEDIPRSIEDTLRRFGIDVKVDRICLLEEQVIEWGLPPKPTKKGDSRTRSWTGLGVVELESVKRPKLHALAEEAIMKYFDEDIYSDLMVTEEEEQERFEEEVRAAVEAFFD